jgi:hypothetical protein
MVAEELDLLRHGGLPHDLGGIGFDAIVVFVPPGTATFLEEGLVDQRERCGHAS